MFRRFQLKYLFYILFSGGVVFAQNPATDSATVVKTTRSKSLQIGLGLTATNYVGDLTQSFWSLNRFYPGGNISLQTDGKARLKGQVNFGLGTFAEQRSYDYITSDDPKVTPNNFVYTPFFYGDVRFRYRFLRSLPIQPHISIGAGILTFSPLDGEDNALFEAPKTRPKGEDYETFTFYVPASAGLVFKISPMVALGVDYTYRRVFTDYLDNIGQLGKVKGNDYLQSLQLSMLVTPNPTEQPRSKVTPPDNKEVPIYKPKLNKDSIRQVRDSLLAFSKAKRKWEKQLKTLRPVDSLVAEEEVYLDVLERQEAYFKVPQQTLEDEISYLDVLLMEDSLKEDSVQVKETYENLVYSVDATKEDSTTAVKYLIKNGIKIPSNLPMPPAPRNDGCPDLWVCLEEKEWRELNFFYYECKRGDTYPYLYNRFKIRKSTIMTLNAVAKNDAPPASGLLLMPDVRKWMGMLPDEKKIRTLSGIGFFEPEKVEVEVVEKTALSEEEDKIQTAILEKRFIYYLVNSSDTYESIAQRFKITKEVLLQLNPSNTTKLVPNTYLRIPDIK